MEQAARSEFAVISEKPVAVVGTTVGLLGGSFDPPHAGHVHITKRALRAFRLDQVWWLVSPGNPLKPDAPAVLARRMAAAGSLVGHPRVKVTDLEARLGTRHTAETLAVLGRIYPGVSFVWLMGADNLRSFHHWERWDEIMRRVPVGVLARPGEQIAAGLSPAARRFARFRLPMERAGCLARSRAPCWTLVAGPMLDLSSTSLRSMGAWQR
jgi:nicotinate-nucleotide adenylyltransferase